MHISQSDATTATGTSASGTPPTPDTSETAITSDFETFLKMLTAQIKNQDPLSPLEGTEFAEQLATFSGVEQQVRTNDLLSALGTQFSTMGLAQMAGWVGMEARAAAPVQFDRTPIEVSPNPAASASRAELIVRDQFGTVVQRLDIPVSAESFEWAGVGTDGTPLPNGIYSFSVESFDDQELITDSPAEVYAPVIEVRGVDGETIAVLKGGAQVSTSAISALRQPGG